MPAYSFTSANVRPPKVVFNKIYPPDLNYGNPKEKHDELLQYLLSRLDSVSSIRSMRLQRYAAVDRQISTWQKLSEEDTQRANKQDITNQAQAIHMNLPLGQLHMDDMASFYAGIYSPEAGSFLKLPKMQTQAQSKALVDKMNQDAKKSKYYKNLTTTLRRLLKYNIGGFHDCWYGGEDATGYNSIESIDVYNHLYDGAIEEPSDIAKKAEWSATVCVEDLRSLKKMETDGEAFGIGNLITDDAYVQAQALNAKYYKFSPRVAGLTDNADGKSGSGKTMNWDAYGASIATDGFSNIAGHEVIYMYCWLIPSQFNLGGDKATDEFTLYRFSILDANQIIAADNISAASADTSNVASQLKGYYNQIPHFIGYLVNDDMKESQRSQAELINPFSSYASFLMNADIDNTRGAIWGITVYDPTAIDMGNIPKGSTAARIPSKAPGRDVQTMVKTFNSEADTSQTMQQLSALLAMYDRFFPAQSMPSQIAGMDRAIQSQVAAVVQGASRKHHMLVRTMDDDIMGPMRMQAYANIVRYGAAEINGLEENDVIQILGSGLQQLNIEAAASQLKELIFTLIQNPQSAQGIDLLALINYWSGMLTIPEDLSVFVKQAPAAAQGTPAPGGPAPVTPPAAATPATY